MRRFYTALGLIVFVLAFSACSTVFQAVQAVINAPGAAVAAVRGPGDTVGFPIRYETRPTVTQELVLQADGTYAIRNVNDSTVADTGRYTLVGDSLIVGACRLSVGPVWLKGACLGKSRWRESPQNTRWPPAPKETPRTAFLPADRRRLAIETL